MKILKVVTWLISLLLNLFLIFIGNPDGFLTDNIAYSIGRILGIFVLSYIILSPLYLFKKKELVRKFLPFVYLLVSLLLVFTALASSPQEESTSPLSGQESVRESSSVMILSPGWEKREPTGENMIFLATKGNNVITVHQRENPENITFGDLSEDERKAYSELMLESTKGQFEGVEFLESAFKTTGNKDIFYMVYKRLISGSKTINLSQQFFDDKLYTLTAISPEEDFSSNRQEIEQIFESFNPSST